MLFRSCLVDTFQLAEERQQDFFTTENTERVKKQKSSPIFVVIGNPPYNVGQVNENDKIGRASCRERV